MQVVASLARFCCRRTDDGEVRLLDDEEQARKDEARRQEVQEYRAFREQVEKNREAERIERNLIKRLRLDLFEQLQVRARCDVIVSWFPITC